MVKKKKNQSSNMYIMKQLNAFNILVINVVRLILLLAYVVKRFYTSNNHFSKIKSETFYYKLCYSY